MYFYNLIMQLLTDELIDQVGDRAPHAPQDTDSHEGTEANFSSGGISGFSSGDFFFSGGRVSVHGVSPIIWYLLCLV